MQQCKYSAKPSSRDAFIPPIWTLRFIAPTCMLTNKYARCIFLGLSFIDFPRPRFLSQLIPTVLSSYITDSPNDLLSRNVSSAVVRGVVVP